MPWLQLVLDAEGQDPDRLAQWLEGQGAVSLSLQDAADEPLYEPPPGATPLWSHTRVTALFESDHDLPATLAALAAELGALPPHQVLRLEDQVWERVWLADFKPLRFGERLWVVPNHCAPPEPTAVNLRLDPGLAFGTGTHPTTALCLEWLAGADLDGRTVVDYGCGSGILAIAAALLGARRVVATDLDPQALIATRENAEQNGVADRLVLGLPGHVSIKPADILLANILAGPLIALAPTFSTALTPGGRIVLAGLLADQAEEVAHAYRSGFTIAAPCCREGWARLDGIRL
jgi:ribosomal protein L11 methyltransferase